MNFVQAFVQIEGVRTHYLTAGHGPTLLLIHGGGSGADARGNWKAVMPTYAKHFRVVAVDMPGFGESARPDPATFDYGQTMRNRHMAAFVEHIGGGKPIDIIGNSMGGATALGVAIERPELVSKLVLMGSAGLDISNPDPAAKKALGSYDYTVEGMRKLVGYLAGSKFEITDEMVTYRHALTMRPGSREAMQAIHQRLKEDKMTYARELIASVQAPTLVVGGKEDQVAVLSRTYGYLDLIPNSWGFVLPHVGHWVMIEAPEAFAAITLAFLTGSAFGD
ncbi:alpha/beta hydrolase [Novosphingobium sp.]|uniref:alpha/beta fold hydrolase n=1 Tax=Novosphingobium sp. TaxID=1874826 RepID=UPI00262CC243|nr:alpha/beta hydrolase [Novosphingobium sp.]